jgi:hypothetical protein
METARKPKYDSLERGTNEVETKAAEVETKAASFEHNGAKGPDIVR